MQRITSVAALAAVALTIPATAGAATSAGGQTDLALASSAAKALTSAGVKVTPVGTAASADGSIPFPVTRTVGGKTLRAIDHTGGLKLSRGQRSLTLTNFRIVVKQGAPTTLSAKVGKARATVFRLDAKRTKVTADGLDTKIGPVGVKLGAIGAGAIRATLGVKLPTGYTLGTARVTLQTAATRVTFDPGTAAALTSLGVSVAPTAPAVAGAALQFPISNKGGKIALDAPITHHGGLTFTAGAKSLTVADYTIDPKAGLLYAEKSPVGRLPLFKVDLTAIKTATPGVQVRVDGAKLSLTADAAGALNATFGVTAFTENLAIGTAQIVARPLK